jgi:hypothetical protein
MKSIASILGFRYQYWRRAAKLGGFAHTAAALAQKVLYRIFPEWLVFVEDYCLMACHVPTTPPLGGRVPEGLRIYSLRHGSDRKEEQGDQSETLAAIKALEAIQPGAESRLNRGAWAVLAVYKTEVAGFVWVSVRHHQEEKHLRFTLREPERVVWDYGNQVLPKFRLTPVYPVLWDAVLREFRELGIEWSLSHISAFNSYSRHVHDRMRLVKVGRIVAVTLCGIRLAFDPHSRRLAWTGPRGQLEVSIAMRGLSRQDLQEGKKPDIDLTAVPLEEHLP